MTNQNSPKILLIDDEADILHLLARRLAKAHLDVTCASSGEKGIELLQSQTFQAVLCDMNMPGGLSGFEVYEQCVAKLQPRPVFFFVSGHGSESLEFARAESLNVEGVFAKPLNAKELIERLNSFLKFLPAASL